MGFIVALNEKQEEEKEEEEWLMRNKVYKITKKEPRL